MLTDKVGDSATTEWASSVVFAPKKDGSLRFCVDHRRLNVMTVRDSYPIPKIDECIDSLGTAAIFSTLDANSGYWQIEMYEKNVDKTDSVTYNGLYRYTRMLFGLKNAPVTFQRAINVILTTVNWQYALVYIEDVIIFSSTP